MARANGQGTLVKRGKFWTARWVVNGKVFMRTTKCTSKRDAEKKLAEFTKPFQEKTEIDIIENLAAKVRAAEAKSKASINENAPPVKIDELVNTYIDDVSTSKLSANSERLYNVAVKMLGKSVSKELVHEVTEDDAEKFLEGMKKRSAVSTFNCYLRVLNALFEVAMKHDYRIRKNVWHKFNYLKDDKSQSRRELTDDEVKRLCEEAYKVSDEVGMLFTVGACTGLRKSDCCNLKWSSVDMQKKLLKVLPIKTKRNGKYAILPIHPTLYAKLEKAQHEGEEYVMPSMKARYDTGRIDTLIDKVFVNAGIDKSIKTGNGKAHVSTGFHALRHYFISNCVRQGIPVNVVQQMVAHSSASMSLAYSHVQEADLHLPDFESGIVKVPLKKSTVEALDKARGVFDLDDFLMKLLEGKPATFSRVKAKESLELEKEIDRLFAEQS